MMIILLLRERLCWPTGTILIAPQTSLSKGRVGLLICTGYKLGRLVSVA